MKLQSLYIFCDRDAGRPNCHIFLCRDFQRKTELPQKNRGQGRLGIERCSGQW